MRHTRTCRSVIPALAAGISPCHPPSLTPHLPHTPPLTSAISAPIDAPYPCPQIRHTRACRGYLAVSSTIPRSITPAPLTSVIPALPFPSFPRKRESPPPHHPSPAAGTSPSPARTFPNALLETPCPILATADIRRPPAPKSPPTEGTPMPISAILSARTLVGGIAVAAMLLVAGIVLGIADGWEQAGAQGGARAPRSAKRRRRHLRLVTQVALRGDGVARR